MTRARIQTVNYSFNQICGEKMFFEKVSRESQKTSSASLYPSCMQYMKSMASSRSIGVSTSISMFLIYFPLPRSKLEAIS